MTTKSEIKLIALDMDGTLLTPDLEVSQANVQAIQQAMDKGVQVMLCTGRWLSFCHPYAEALGLNTYLVTVNGGEIWTSDKTLVERHLLDSNVTKEMWLIGRDLGLNSWLVAADCVYKQGETPDDFQAHDWLKIGFNSTDINVLNQMHDKLSQFEGLELTNSLPTNIEVNPIGVNKATGLERVCQEMDITMGEVMAVGDSLNDIKMIAEAGLGIAMGNAQEQVKATADHITDTNEQDGVAKAIERFILSQ